MYYIFFISEVDDNMFKGLDSKRKYKFSFIKKLNNCLYVNY